MLGGGVDRKGHYHMNTRRSGVEMDLTLLLLCVKRSYKEPAIYITTCRVPECHILSSVTEQNQQSRRKGN